jgi:hypothetical protein
MKQQQAGALPLASRVEALEKSLAESNKRINALMVILEKLQGTTPAPYKAQFDRWPTTDDAYRAWLNKED